MKRATLLLSALLSLFALRAKEPTDLLRQQALDGDLNAMVSLGDEFFKGKKRPRNLSLAAFWYRKAAQSNHPLGRYRYGVCLEFGWGTAKVPRLAFEEYKAAETFPAAQLRRAEMLLKGVAAGGGLPDIVPDREKAVDIMRKLCKANFPPALLKLARTLYEFPPTRKSHGEEIYTLVQRSSDTESPAPEVLTFQAKLLQEGVGVKADQVYARALLEIAARKNDPEAQYLFAETLESGKGTPVDQEKAFQYYSKAAQSAFPAALVRMGDYHLEGKFLAHSPEKAFGLFQQASRKRSSAAFYKMGWCYENGIGITKDLRKAFNAYEQSANLGDPLGNFHAGRCFLDGIGVSADPAGAFFFFRRSAALGCKEGMLALAECLRTGRGCSQNEALSRRLKDEASKL